MDQEQRRILPGKEVPLAGTEYGDLPQTSGGIQRTQMPQRMSWSPLRFIQQFGPGRPRSRSNSSNMVPQLVFVLYISSCFTIAASCSSRSTPKPRPGLGGLGSGRPNVTFQTYSCPEAYARWYCLNGATCFAVKIRDSILYNCECADGYMGQRCEFKDLDGSYLPSKEREIHRAGVAGGLTIVVLLPVLFYLVYSLTRRYQKRRLQRRFVVSCPEEGLTPYHLMPPTYHPHKLCEKQQQQQQADCQPLITSPFCSVSTVSQSPYLSPLPPSLQQDGLCQWQEHHRCRPPPLRH